VTKLYLKRHKNEHSRKTRLDSKVGFSDLLAGAFLVKMGSTSANEISLAA
jgi:hypothetical protein